MFGLPSHCLRGGDGGGDGGISSRSPPTRMWSRTASSVRPSPAHHRSRPSMLFRPPTKPVQSRMSASQRSWRRPTSRRCRASSTPATLDPRRIDVAGERAAAPSRRCCRGAAPAEQGSRSAPSSSRRKGRGCPAAWGNARRRGATPPPRAGFGCRSRSSRKGEACPWRWRGGGALGCWMRGGEERRERCERERRAARVFIGDGRRTVWRAFTAAQQLRCDTHGHAPRSRDGTHRCACSSSLRPSGKQARH